MLSVLCCLWQIVKFCFAGHRELFDTGERVRAMRDFIGEMGGREPAQFPMPPPHGGRCVLFWVSWRSPSCDVWVYDKNRTNQADQRKSPGNIGIKRIHSILFPVTKKNKIIGTSQSPGRKTKKSSVKTKRKSLSEYRKRRFD